MMDLLLGLLAMAGFVAFFGLWVFPKIQKRHDKRRDKSKKRID